MQALRFSMKKKQLELVKIPIPKVEKPEEVLIKVAFAGICGTDLHIIQGEFPCKTSGQFTLGHEFSGTVVEIGSNVKTFRAGDKVTVDPNEGCRCCKFCHLGKPHFCQTGGINNTIGIWKDGGWAEYCVAPVNIVHLLPAKLSLEQGVLAEPLSCLAHGLDLINPIPIGCQVLIIGAGIIGNLWICALHLQGHKNVTVSEPSLSRLEQVRKLDFDYTLLTPDTLKKKQLADAEYLFDVIIDCSGYPPAIEQGVTLLQRGGKLCCFGVAPPEGRILISPFDLYMKEASIFGVNINPFTFPKSIDLMEAMGDRYLNYTKLGIKTFYLCEYEDAMKLLKKAEIAKAKYGCQKSQPKSVFWNIFGILCSTLRISPFDLYMKEASIFGVNINPFTFPKSIGLMEAMGDRYLNYTKLGIKTFYLCEYEDAMKLLKKAEIAKAVFKF